MWVRKACFWKLVRWNGHCLFVANHIRRQICFKMDGWFFVTDVVTSMYVHQHNRTYQIQIEYTFLQPNTQTKNSIAVKIHPWDKLPDQGTIVLENWYSSIHFWGKRYYCRLSAQHKICCQIVQKSFFLEPVKDKELTSTIYPLSFHFVFLFLLQISLVCLGATWKTDVDICECQWVGDHF